MPGDYSKSDIGLSNVSNNLQLIASNNLYDLTSSSSARTNLGYSGGTGIAISNSNGVISLSTTSISQFVNDAGYLTVNQDLSGYLSTTSAASTYLSKSDADSSYLSQINAESTYLTLAASTSLPYLKTESEPAFNAASSSYVPKTTTVNNHALSGNISVSQSDIGLGNVENTALSTWTGSSNITTLGTIGTGVWNGTAILPANGGTGLSTITAHGVMIGEGTSNVAPTTAGAMGQVLQSGGASADPSWSTSSALAGTMTSGNAVSLANNYQVLTSDFTDSNGTTALQNITGLSWTMGANIAQNMPFECHILYMQSTAVSDAFGFQVNTTPATRFDAGERVYTQAATVSVSNPITNLTTTTATPLASFTPTGGAVLPADFYGLIQYPSIASPGVVNLMVKQATAADVIVIKAGSWCREW
jgi:hypothetical protein